ncbi:hypothetical protein YT28_20375 [Salmonella enterica subsp. salamae]|nr:hypothetical protein [Salmonella enterica subsp. salamae]EDW4472606.1 hypothetical protein [Salmonella enterica subsp. salamae]
MFDWIHSGWLQGVGFIAVMFYMSHITGKAQKEIDADLQAKIDRIWENMEKLEERANRHSDWNLARCEKMMYDAERSRLVDAAHEKCKAEPKEGESEIDAVFRLWREIDEAAYIRFPKKEIEDFMK